MHVKHLTTIKFLEVGQLKYEIRLMSLCSLDPQLVAEVFVAAKTTPNKQQKRCSSPIQKQQIKKYKRNSLKQEHFKNVKIKKSGVTAKKFMNSVYFSPTILKPKWTKCKRNSFNSSASTQETTKNQWINPSLKSTLKSKESI